MFKENVFKLTGSTNLYVFEEIFLRKEELSFAVVHSLALTKRYRCSACSVFAYRPIVRHCLCYHNALESIVLQSVIIAVVCPHTRSALPCPLPLSLPLPRLQYSITARRVQSGDLPFRREALRLRAQPQQLPPHSALAVSTVVGTFHPPPMFTISHSCLEICNTRRLRLPLPRYC